MAIVVVINPRKVVRAVRKLALTVNYEHYFITTYVAMLTGQGRDSSVAFALQEN